MSKDRMTDAAKDPYQEFWNNRNKEGRKPHLSISQIKKFLMCARMWGYRHRKGIKEPQNAAMLQGHIWHAVIEENYKQKILSGTDMPVDDMTDLFVYQWDQEIEAKPIVLKDGENLDDLREMGVKITRVHRLDIAPSVFPEEVEKWFDVDLGDDFPLDLVGRYDLIEPGGVIIDNKSYKRRPSQADVDRDLQFSGYALAYRMSRGKIEDHFRLDIVVKKKKPEAIQLYTKRTTAQVRWFLDLLERVVHQMKSHQPLMPNPNGWHCSKKFCGYWDKCQIENDHP